MAATPRTGRSWSGDQIRAAFLDFYEQRGHRRMASASLVPDDPTVLLTIAGMLPFKPVFLGQAERPAPRAIAQPLGKPLPRCTAPAIATRCACAR